jgi:hypothetical protein
MKRQMIFLLTALLWTAPAFAEGRTPGQCSQEFDQCLNECDTKYGEDTGKRAACVPQCSGKYAACDAGVAYDKAKPWIEEQAEKTKKFFDGLMEDLKKDGEPAPQPEGQTKPI